MEENLRSKANIRIEFEPNGTAKLTFSPILLEYIRSDNELAAMFPNLRGYSKSLFYTKVKNQRRVLFYVEIAPKAIALFPLQTYCKI